MKSRIKSAIAFLPTRLYERYVIKQSALGLFHGQECFAAYARFCPVAQLVYDVHLGPEMIMNEGQMQKKSKHTSGRPLRICYAGRVEPEKGARDWIEVLRRVKNAGCKFSAVWIGNGSLLEEMQAATKNAGFEHCVEFPGRFDHGKAISVIREADIMLFCHKLPESPRCLIESLMSGTPIVGYDSHFPRNLIATHGVANSRKPTTLTHWLNPSLGLTGTGRRFR
jgi:colanic acid/amylovoran biosynthesis glycosyltransferase